MRTRPKSRALSLSPYPLVQQYSRIIQVSPSHASIVLAQEIKGSQFQSVEGIVQFCTEIQRLLLSILLKLYEFQLLEPDPFKGIQILNSIIQSSFPPECALISAINSPLPFICGGWTKNRYREHTDRYEYGVIRKGTLDIEVKINSNGE